jgi:hypothetical protein
MSVKEPWCAGVHARKAGWRLAYRRVFHPRAGDGDVMIVNSL